MELSFYRAKLDCRKNAFIWLLVLGGIAVGLSAIILPWKLLLAGAIFVPAVLYLVKNPKRSYYLGILLLPFWTVTITGETQVTGVPEFRWADVAFVIAGVGFVLKGLLERNLDFRTSHIEIPLFLLFLWMGASFFWSNSLSASSTELIRKTYGLVIFYLTLNFVRGPGDLNKVIGVWILAALIAALFSIHELFSEGLAGALRVVARGQLEVWGKGVRSSAFFVTPNKLGLFLNIAVLLGITQYARTTKRFGKQAILLIEAVLLVAVICTLSRTSWVTLLLGSVLLTPLLPKMWTRLFLALVAGAVLLFFFSSGSYRALALQRLLGIFQPGATLSLIQRTDIWTTTVRVIVDHPFVGVGIGNYPAAARSLGVSGALSAPHNLYFYLLSEFGIIGLALFLLLVAAVFSKLLRGFRARISKNDRLVVGVLLVCFIMVLVQSTITSYVLREGEIWVLLGITMAAVQVLAPQESTSTVGVKRGKSQNSAIGSN